MKVLIVGGGFGGLNAAQGLKKADVELLLIDRANHHLFQPLLYQVATSALASSTIAVPIRAVLAKQPKAKVLLADIVAIDKEAKQVIVANGDTYPYDVLILAPGASHAYFGHPEWEAYAPGLKTLGDALQIREKVLLSYERAERCTDHVEAEKFMRFVIVGGGPTGVEMAGAIAEIAHKSLTRNFRNIKPEQSKIYLIEGLEQILPAFPKELAEKAKKNLESMGVEVFLKTFVTDITAQGVYIGERFIETPNIVWAAGNEASPILASLDVPLDRSRRVIVKPDLSVPGHPEIFVIGDAACSYDKNGKPLPGVAPVAIQQGQYVANLIRKKIPVDQRKPFKYFDKGMMATIGKAKAVAKVGKLQMSGFIAWLAWCFVHVLYLISFSNRIFVLMQWLYLYLFNERRNRLIVFPVSEREEPLHDEHRD